jgi:hypothetical protein
MGKENESKEWGGYLRFPKLGKGSIVPLVGLVSVTNATTLSYRGAKASQGNIPDAGEGGQKGLFGGETRTNPSCAMFVLNFFSFCSEDFTQSRPHKSRKGTVA